MLNKWALQNRFHNLLPSEKVESWGGQVSNPSEHGIEPGLNDEIFKVIAFKIIKPIQTICMMRSANQSPLRPQMTRPIDDENIAHVAAHPRFTSHGSPLASAISATTLGFFLISAAAAARSFAEAPANAKAAAAIRSRLFSDFTWVSTLLTWSSSFCDAMANMRCR